MKTYRIINLFFAGVAAIILLYSGIFSTEKSDYPIRCIHKNLLGYECSSCGLSRGFSEAVRGNFSEAEQLNLNTLKIFIFIAGQFMLRLLIAIVLKLQPLQFNKIIRFDIFASAIWFIYAWFGLIADTLTIISKTLKF
ncbi:MAG TPA: hypothetical protein DCQ31_17025 [Bacteroidales bacterium]|nr:hypothetical protein [Bacteroidales bacterium]